MCCHHKNYLMTHCEFVGLKLLSQYIILSLFISQTIPLGSKETETLFLEHKHLQGLF